MGSMCNNYGTFVAPPGCHVESYGSEGDTGYHQRSQEYAPSFEEGTTTSSRVEHNSTPGGSEGRFGARFKKAIFSEMDGDRGRVRGSYEGCASPPRHGNSQARKGKRHAVKHVVRQGDSVETLAQLYGTTPDQVRVWNRKHFPIGEPGFIFPGQILTLRTRAVDQTRDADGTSASPESNDRTSARRRNSEGDGRRKRMLYKVLEGDSLKEISKRLNVKEGDIRGLNRGVFPIGEAGALVPGQMLTVFAEECDYLSEGQADCSGRGERERAFVRSIAERKNRTRSSFSFGTRGSGVVG